MRLEKEPGASQLMGGLARQARKLGFCLSLGQWRPTKGF